MIYVKISRIFDALSIVRQCRARLNDRHQLRRWQSHGIASALFAQRDLPKSFRIGFDFRLEKSAALPERTQVQIVRMRAAVTVPTNGN